MLAAAVVVLFTTIGLALQGVTDSGTGVFQTGDGAAMVGLGLLAALVILAFTRPRVWADADGVRVRNIVGGHYLPWEIVRSIQFGRGAAWASLELYDDDLIAVLAVQAADKEYALATLQDLRALLVAHQGRAGISAVGHS